MYVCVHVCIYVYSKKGLALPPSLPPLLHSFLLNSPRIPSIPRSPFPTGASAGGVSAPSPTTSTPPTAAADTGKASIASAFDCLDIPAAATTTATTEGHLPGGHTTSSTCGSSINGVKNIPKVSSPNSDQLYVRIYGF